MPTLTLRKNHLPRQKHKKAIHSPNTFLRTHSIPGTVPDTGDTRVNETDSLWSLRANSGAGKVVIKQPITD